MPDKSLQLPPCCCDALEQQRRLLARISGCICLCSWLLLEVCGRKAGTLLLHPPALISCRPSCVPALLLPQMHTPRARVSVHCRLWLPLDYITRMHALHAVWGHTVTLSVATTQGSTAQLRRISGCTFPGLLSGQRKCLSAKPLISFNWPSPPRCPILSHSHSFGSPHTVDYCGIGGNAATVDNCERWLGYPKAGCCSHVTNLF